MIKKLLLFVGLFLSVWATVYGDTTTYTYSGSASETDPNSQITLDSNTATFTNFQRSQSAYVNWDETADAITGDYTFDFTVNVSSLGTSGIAYIWAVANFDNNVYNGAFVSKINAHTLRWYATATNASIALYEIHSSTTLVQLDIDNTTLTTGTFYIRVKRDVSVGTYGTLYADFYNSAANRDAETSPVISLSGALHEDEDFQYVYALSSQNQGSSELITGYTEDLLWTSSSPIVGASISQGSGTIDAQHIKTVSIDTGITTSYSIGYPIQNYMHYNGSFWEVFYYDGSYVTAKQSLPSNVETWQGEIDLLDGYPASSVSVSNAASFSTHFKYHSSYSFHDLIAVDSAGGSSTVPFYEDTDSVAHIEHSTAEDDTSHEDFSRPNIGVTNSGFTYTGGIYDTGTGDEIRGFHYRSSETRESISSVKTFYDLGTTNNGSIQYVPNNLSDDMFALYAVQPSAGSVGTIYFTEHDYVNDTWATADSIVTDLSGSVSYRGVITEDYLYVLYQEDTTDFDIRVIKYNLASETWDSSSTEIITDNYAAAYYWSAWSNVGEENEIWITYYDGTDITMRSYDGTTVGGSVPIVSSPTLKHGWITSPLKALGKSGVMYHTSDNVLRMVEVGMSRSSRHQTGQSVGYGRVAYAAPLTYNGRTLATYIGEDSIAKGNIWLDSASRWVYPEAQDIAIRYWDSVHNATVQTITSDGYVYFAQGGRNAGDTTDLSVYRSSYPLDNVDFNLSITSGAWVDVTPSGDYSDYRGYKELHADESNNAVLYLVKDTGDTIEILVHDGSSWVTTDEMLINHHQVDLSTAGGSRYAYSGPYWLSNLGQGTDGVSTHIFYTIRNDHAFFDAASWSDGIFYLRVESQGDGTFEYYRKDGVAASDEHEITSANDPDFDPVLIHITPDTHSDWHDATAGMPWQASEGYTAGDLIWDDGSGASTGDGWWVWEQTQSTCTSGSTKPTFTNSYYTDVTGDGTCAWDKQAFYMPTFSSGSYVAGNYVKATNDHWYVNTAGGTCTVEPSETIHFKSETIGGCTWEEQGQWTNHVIIITKKVGAYGSNQPIAFAALYDYDDAATGVKTLETEKKIRWDTGSDKWLVEDFVTTVDGLSVVVGDIQGSTTEIMLSGAYNGTTENYWWYRISDDSGDTFGPVTKWNELSDGLAYTLKMEPTLSSNQANVLFEERYSQDVSEIGLATISYGIVNMGAIKMGFGF